MKLFWKEDTSNRCCNGGTQHNFQPRFDEQANPYVVSIKNVPTAAELRSLFYYNIYVKDVCAWCGKEVTR